MSAGRRFRLVLRSPYLRLIALLIVLLNVVNTTGEYLVARLLANHVNDLALLTPHSTSRRTSARSAADYQFWVNVTRSWLQAFVASRLVKYTGAAGALLALPLIALGGYALIAAGASFTMIRWIKTAENATDYSS
jgi:AAA family ATP:ADP antiporter